MSDAQDQGKMNAGRAAADYVEDGMTVGLGTGSTAKHLVDALGEKIRNGAEIFGVPTSEATRRHALSVGIDIIEPDETTKIDIAIDGTDEADPHLNLIKGGGAALLREKIVAGAADRFIVIADKSKRVATLGAFPLPVEIEPFGWALTIQAMRDVFAEHGLSGKDLSLRGDEGVIVKSDGGHFIVDCKLGRIQAPADLDAALRALPGVIETGLFCGMAECAIFGDQNGVSIDKP